MSGKRQREWMEKLDRCYKIVLQSRTGISAIQVAEKMGVHRSTAHKYLNSLELMGKINSQHGLWYPSIKEKRKTLEDSLFLKRIFEQIDEIKEVLFDDLGLNSEAFGRMRFLIAQLPPPLKKEMKLAEKKVLEIMKETPEEQFQSACYHYTRVLLDKLFTLLYREYSVKDTLG